MTSTPLDRLLGLVPEPVREALRSRPAIDRELDEGFALARARWPGIEVDDHAYWTEVARRIDESGEPPAGDALAEIYVAVACASGDPAAIAAFEAVYVANLAVVLGRFRLPPATLDEIKQTLRSRLLVGAPPRVVHYAGRGGLHRLVTVVAVRLAIDAIRDPRGVEVDVERAAAATRDPELEYMHRAYSSAFKEAFERAISELAPRDRTLLRLHIVDELRIDDIAALYNLHRASVARRLDAARQAVARNARRHLRGAGIDRDQLEQAFALVHSELDLSVTRVLRATAPEVP